jgi:hypothetical protein
MADFYVHDADQIALAVVGIPIEAGFAEGEFLTIEVPEKFTTKRGARGDVTRSKTFNGESTATIRLMQKSPSNAALSALAALDEKAPNGAGVGPFVAKDMQGATLYTASKCWVKKPADGKFGAEDIVREWQIGIADLVAVEAG